MALTNITDRDDVQAFILDKLAVMRRRIVFAIGDAGLTASGNTASSLKVEAQPMGGVLKGRDYFQGLEIGRPGGPTPRGFVTIIREWMTAKGIVATPKPYIIPDARNKFADAQERGQSLMAQAIAWKIRKVGFPPRRGGMAVSRQTDIYTDIIDEELEQLKKEVGMAVVAQMKNIYSPTTGLKLEDL